MRKLVASGLLILVLGLLASCSGDEPDRVVGVVLRCTDPASVIHPLPTLRPSSIRSRPSAIERRRGTPTPVPVVVERPDVVIPAQDLEGAICEKVPFNRRQDITVRTSSGGSYMVTVPDSVVVKVGDRWPPK